MKNYNVAILGATGVVGQEILKVLEEKNFPIAKLKLFTSSIDANKPISYRGESVFTEIVTEDSFSGLDIVFGAVDSSLAKEYAKAIIDSGAVFIDNSSAFRLDPTTPLIVSGINDEDIFTHHGIISNPNCSTIIALTALYPINKLSPILSIVASTYQAVSGAGKVGIDELKRETIAIANDDKFEPKVFEYQIAENVIPKIDKLAENGYTLEELKMLNESRKILHNDDLLVSCTCVRVPVVRSHSISLNIETKDKLDLEVVARQILNETNCILFNTSESSYPMPINTSNQDKVCIGRMREDQTRKNGIALWCCGDQLRRGAATNAVEIAWKLIENETKSM